MLSNFLMENIMLDVIIAFSALLGSMVVLKGLRRLNKIRDFEY